MRVGGGCHAACFLRAYAGAPVTRTLRPSLLRCGERPCDTLRALPENTAHQPKHPAAMQHAKPRQPSPAPHAKRQATKQHTKKRQPPPPQFARHGAHILNHRDSPTEPGGIPRPPEPQTRRGIDIPRRDIRVSELCEDRSPVGARGNIYTPKLLQSFSRRTQKSRRFRRISGIFLEVRPLGLEPRTH